MKAGSRGRPRRGRSRDQPDRGGGSAGRGKRAAPGRSRSRAPVHAPTRSGRAAAGRGRRGARLVLAGPRAGSMGRAHRRAECAARHHRHAARRCARQLRRTGRDPQPGPPGRGRRPFRVRPRACRGDAALARQHPHRRVPLRARHPRQLRLSAARRPPDPGLDAPRRGLRHRGLRGGVPARQPVRARRRLRRLRRPLRARGGSFRLHRSPSGRPRWWSPWPATGSRRRPSGGSRGCTCSTRTPSTGRRHPSTPGTRRAPTTGRSPTRTTRSGRSSPRRPRRRRAPYVRRGHVRPRGIPRRARRADPRPVRLRGDAPGAADARAGRSRGRRNDRARAVVASAPARHVDILPSVLDALALAGASRAARSFAAGPGGGTMPAPSRSRTSRRSPPPSTGGGRRCAGCWRGGTSTSTCRWRSSTTWRWTPPSLDNLVAGRAGRAGRAGELAALLEDLPASDPLDRRIAETAEVAERLQSLGYLRGSAPAQGELFGRRRPEAPRAPGRGDPPRRGPVPARPGA